MFRSAVCRLSELKAFDASIRITVPFSMDSQKWCMACTAASQTAKCPAHTCKGPAATWMSLLIVIAIVIALPMIRRTVLLIPIGCTRG